MSILRRAAGKHIYVREEHLHIADGQAFVRLKSTANWVDFTKSGWQKPRDLVPLYALRVEARTPEETAWLLTKKENALAESFNAADSLFSLVLGEETEERTAVGRYLRTFRVGVLRGLFHHPRMEEPLERIPAKSKHGATFRVLPPGVIYERR